MGIMVKATGARHCILQGVLAGMAERRMAEVVGEAERLRQVLVQPQHPGDGAPDLRDFYAVGEADAVMISIGRDKDLGLVTKPAKGDGMNDAIAVALEDVARPARSGIDFRMGPAARLGWLRGKRGSHSEGSFLIGWPGLLAHVKASIRTDARSSAKIFASSLLRNGPINRRARPGSSAT